MSEQAKPKWMSDPKVSDIDKGKLDFLQSIVFETRGKSQKELIPFLMNVMKKGKASQISFSDKELANILAAIKLHSTSEELAQIDKFMAMYKNGLMSTHKKL